MAASSSPRRRLLLGAATAVVALLVSLGAAELLLRALGRGPLAFGLPAGAATPYRPHARLGWEHAPGRFALGGATAHFTADGRRRAAPRDARRGPPLVLVGGSFTEGYGVRDEETFAWRLQERLPQRTVLNFGTGGHGTLQALYRLEEALPGLAAEGERLDVVYGFMWHHPVRNVATAAWRKQLLDQSAGDAERPVAVPYALAGDDGGLRHLPPAAWPLVAPASRSALVHALTEAGVRLATRDHTAQAGRVTQALLARMAELVASHGGRVLVAFLYAPPAQVRAYGAPVRAHGGQVVDCTLRDYASPRLRDPRTGHPSPEAHARYAGCIEAALVGERGPGRTDAPRGQAQARRRG